MDLPSEFPNPFDTVVESAEEWLNDFNENKKHSPMDPRKWSPEPLTRESVLPNNSKEEFVRALGHCAQQGLFVEVVLTRDDGTEKHIILDQHVTEEGILASLDYSNGVSTNKEAA